MPNVVKFLKELLANKLKLDEASHVELNTVCEHRRVKGTRNGPKTEKMGQRTKSTRPVSPHTGKPHGCVNLAESKHDLHGLTTHPCLFNKLDHDLK
ncbi:Antagonist of mitotic exit network 1 [Gossypium arboreum]|uniref:Antagonist of mitotic exit network 1 n=1 Tax=Gossypium arboreum TaxID=29729 RepID=A0A0B0MIP4_GOSAR|nr:Antagonist of mitotic exit network 1 [Gossypium arboreum]